MSPFIAMTTTNKARDLVGWVSGLITLRSLFKLASTAFDGQNLLSQPGARASPQKEGLATYCPVELDVSSHRQRYKIIGGQCLQFATLQLYKKPQRKAFKKISSIKRAGTDRKMSPFLIVQIECVLNPLKGMLISGLRKGADLSL